MWHRDYDQELLKLIKSKFTPMVEDADGDDAPIETPNHMKVIRPFLKSEYDQYMKSLPPGDKAFVMSVIHNIDAWDYDVWSVQDFANRGALFYTAYALFMRWDFLRKFNMDEEIAINFISQIEAGYHPNPYHNSMHGGDVMQILHYILSPGGLKETAQLTDEDLLAAIIAGMIHDYDHPGLNNNFHVKVQSYLATLYNNRSILENHHCAEVFELMKNPRLNILGGMTDSQRRDIRETIIEMVLWTDMGLHAKIFGQWKRRISQDHDLYKRKDDQRLVLSMAIKMADINNCGRPENLYLKWTTKLSEEFFLQGDNERARGDPVSPFMDRFFPSMAKSQVAFMNYVVIPMFESISDYLPAMHFSVDRCEQNKSYWASNDDSI
jgi:3',5'-cyclic-nucleotide phosphodiesterase